MEPSTTMTLSERAEALEMQLMSGLDPVPVKSVLYTSGERDPRRPPAVTPDDARFAGRTYLMGADSRLPALPSKPTLRDFFERRMGPSSRHVLQSAAHARRAGCSENVILACLLHDIGVGMFIRADHGYWGAQLIEPYVDEEVSWAIRAHQVLRFYPDPAYGYEYPELYVRFFGDAYEPEPYVAAAYERIRNHRWYGTARLITCNDIYSFDPDAVVSFDAFEDIVERAFRQPAEGLGWDDTPSAHMWRTINWPTRFL